MARATPATSDGANRQRHRDANGIASMNRKARRSGARAGHAPAPQAVNQLVGLCRAQQFSRAAPLARDFTRKWPGHPVGWNALAMCMQAMGKLDEAIRAYRKALEIEPDNADGHNNLGLLLVENGMPEEAIRSYRRAVRIRPGFGFAHYNLGLAFEALEQWSEAADCHRRALEIDPRFAEARNHLGNVLHRMGHMDEAAACYRQVLEQQPDYAEVYSNLGNVLVDQGDFAGAESCYRHAIELRGDYVEARANLGHLLRKTGRLVESESMLRQALELRPDDPGMLSNLALTLTDLGQVGQAADLYRRVIEQRPDDAEAYDNLGNALADLGNTEAAIEQYRRALRIRPGLAQTRFHLSLVKRFEREDPDRDAIEAELAREDLADRDRIYLEYAAGKAWADVGDQPDRAFMHYARGAQLKRASLDYDIEQDEAMFAETARVFTQERLAAFSGAGHGSGAPVFIVGMPRSGSTLVEQILSSHPRVHGAGERSDLNVLVESVGRRRRKVFPEWVPDLEPDDCRRLGEEYCRTMFSHVGDADRVTDKMLSNFVHAGLIRILLPNARIIHVRREPADTCLSCFTYLFAGRHAITYDLKELGRYYRAYDSLMAHWRSVLPANFLLEVQYEQLVADPEPCVARMLEHCGLEWDDACLAFHRSNRAVRTASSQQVRQPLYRRAVGRWEAYRDHLEPLFEALGPLAPTGQDEELRHDR